MHNKQTGSYYTPRWLSDFIVTYLGKSMQAHAEMSVLEPSCWEGVFIESLISGFPDIKLSRLTIVDINKEAILKAATHFSGPCEVVDWDFIATEFNWNYDLIIWNPPYIHKKYLTDEQKDACLKYYENSVARNKRVLNIWPSFIYKSETLLTKNWVLAFVIPEEILKVNYGKDVLRFLQNKFDRIEIFSIDKIIFWDAWQNTVVIFGFKSHSNPWTYLWEIRANWWRYESSFSGFSVNKINYASDDQKIIWSYLGRQDIRFIEWIAKKLKTVGDTSESQVWIVTWANDSFILSRAEAISNWLMDYSVPIIRKWSYTWDLLNFTSANFSSLVETWKPTFLLNFHDTPDSENARAYLLTLEKKWINQRYKCATYKPNWYNIPNIWASNLIFFKRSHLYPKFILNSSGVNVTDSGYRVRIPWYERQYQFCFYNSLTLLYAELLWRSYGWWVLELTPKEFRSLPIPFFPDIPDCELARFSKLNLKHMDELLDGNDEYLLKGMLGLGNEEIGRIRKIRNSLISKRIK